MNEVLNYKLILIRNNAWVLVFLCLFLPNPSARADTTYIVKKRDSLSVISRRYQVSVERLAKHNGLKDRNKIYPGQRLRIPTLKSDPAFQSNLPQAIRNYKPSSRWKSIIIHHSATKEGTVKGMDSVHRRRGMENGLAYHFVIGNGKGIKDGEIVIGNRWKKQINGGHLKSERQNRTSIGICLVGNFDQTKPSKKQLESLRQLTIYLLDRCNLKTTSIKTHKQYNIVSTRCPGKYFPTKTFISGL